MRRLTVLATALCLGLAACGGGNTARAKTIHVAVTHRVFTADQAQPGDTVICTGGTGGAVIPSRGGVASSTGFKVTVLSGGKIDVQCPAIRALAQPTA
jgi:hypothetical protein